MTLPPHDPRIISIHSAKGGVGKTLTALYLSHILAEKTKNRVIILDLDFCGTTMPDFSNLLPRDRQSQSGFLNFPHFADKNNVNMLRLFKDYLEEPNSSEPGNLHKNETPICLLYESIADPSHKSLFIPSGDFQSDPSFTPMVLFDQFFSLAFCDFILDICAHIAHKNYNDKKQRTYFILDNPPGQNQLTPSLINKLIEFGIDKSKILFVSSPDEMDLEECMGSLSKISLDLYIHQQYLKAIYTIKNDKSHFRPENYFNFTWDNFFSKYDSISVEDKSLRMPSADLDTKTIFLATIINRNMGNYRTHLDLIAEKAVQETISGFYRQHSKGNNVKREVVTKLMERILGSMPVAVLPFDIDIAKIYQTRFYIDQEITAHKEHGEQSPHERAKSKSFITASDRAADQANLSLAEIIKIDTELFAMSIKSRKYLTFPIVGENNIVIFSHILRSLNVIYNYLHYLYLLPRSTNKFRWLRLSPENKTKLTAYTVHRFEEGIGKSETFNWGEEISSFCHVGVTLNTGDSDITEITNAVSELVDRAFNNYKIPSCIQFSFKVLLGVAALEFSIKNSKLVKNLMPEISHQIADSLRLYAVISSQLSKYEKGKVNFGTIINKILTINCNTCFDITGFLRISFKDIVREIGYTTRSFDDINSKHALVLGLQQSIRGSESVSENAISTLRMAMEALYLGKELKCENVENIFNRMDIKEHNTPFFLKNKFFYDFKQKINEVMDVWWKDWTHET